MSVRGLHSLLDSLSSRSRKARHDNFLKILEILDDEGALKQIDDSKEWQSIFLTPRNIFILECNQLNGNVQDTARLFELMKLNDVVTKILIHSCRKYGQIEYKVLAKYFYKTFEPNLKDTFVKKNVDVLEKILNSNYYQACIEEEEWLKLLGLLKSYCEETGDLSVLKIIILIYKCATKHKLHLIYVYKDWDFVSRVCLKLTKDHSRIYKENVLELFQEYCCQCKYDYRRECCQLGENVLHHLLNFIEMGNCDLDFKNKLVDSMLIQINLHYPDGILNLDLIYEHSTEEWQSTIKSMYSKVYDLLDYRDKSVTRDEMYLNDNFIKFAVDVVILMDVYNLKLRTYDDDIGVQYAKRRKFAEVGIKAVMIEIENRFNMNRWHWIHLLTEIIRKYPKIDFEFYTNALNYFSKRLSDFNDCADRFHTMNCLAILLDAERINNWDTSPFDNNWGAIWMTLLNSFKTKWKEPLHNLLRQLIISKKVTDCKMLINLYLSGHIQCRTCCIDTLIVLVEFFTLSESEREKLIQWLLTGEETDHLGTVSTAKALFYLMVKYSVTDNTPQIPPQSNFIKALSYLTYSNDFSSQHTKPAKPELVNFSVHDTLFEYSLTIIGGLFSKQNLKLKTCFDISFLCVRLKQLIIDGNLTELVNSIQDVTDECLKVLFDKLLLYLQKEENRNNKTKFNGMIAALIDLIDCDNCAGDNISRDLIKTLMGILNNADEKLMEDDVVHRRETYCVWNVMRLLCKYSVCNRNQLQMKTTSVILRYDVESKNIYKHSVGLIILKSFSNFQGNFNEDLLTFILNMILSLCADDRYKENNVAINILSILNGYIQFFADSNNQELQSKYSLILNQFCEEKDNYGCDALMILVKCICKFININPWRVKGDVNKLLDNLPSFIKNEHVLVRITVIEVFQQLFLKRDDAGIEFYQTQKSMYVKICECIYALFQDEYSENQRDNFVATTLYIYGTIITSSSNLRSIALFDLLYFCYLKKTNVESLGRMLHKIALVLQFKKSKDLVENYLDYLLEKWNGKRLPLTEFPYSLLGTETFDEFSNKYVSLVVMYSCTNPSSTSEESSPPEDVTKLKHAFPKLFAKYSLINTLQRSDPDLITSSQESILEQFDKIVSKISDQERIQMIQMNLDDILYVIFGFLFDTGDLQNSLQISYVTPNPDKLHANLEVIMATLESLNQYFNDNVINFLYTDDSKILLRINYKLKQEIFTSVSEEDKIQMFYRYTAFLRMLFPILNPNNKNNHFLIRDITYTLLNLIKKHFNYCKEFNQITTQFFIYFTSTVTERIPGVFDPFLNTTCSILVTIVSLSCDLSYQCLTILKHLIFDCHEKLNLQTLKYLDPFPDDTCFGKLKQAQFKIKYNTNEYNVTSVIKYFLKASEFMKIDCSRLSGLKHLLKHLKANRSNLKELYYKQENESADNENLIHRLIYMLIEIATKHTADERIAAAKCLGEIGPADLRTIALKTEQQLFDFNYASNILLINYAVNFLLEYITDDNMVLVNFANKSLQQIMECKSGKLFLTNGNITAVDKEYLYPYISKERKSLPEEKIDTNRFNDFYEKDFFWREVDEQHSDWVKKIIKNLLNSFKSPAYFESLANIVNIKISFGEKILPALINLVLDVNVKCYEMLSASIADFFLQFWNYYTVNKNNNLELKPTVLCMLNIVNIIRLNRHLTDKIDKFDKGWNYLHLALASEYCADYFSAIMFAELWVSSEIQLKNTLNLEIIYETYEEAPHLQSILQKCYAEIGDKEAYHSGHNINPWSNHDMLINSFINKNRYDLVLTQCDIEGLTSVAQALPNILNSFACFNTATNPKIFDVEVCYEAAWKLGQWDLPLAAKNDTNVFSYYNYKALRAFNENDFLTFKESINQARSIEIKRLQHSCFESCKTIYESLAKLQCIQELDDLFYCHDLHLTFNDWLVNDLSNVNDFNHIEKILSHRIACIKIASKCGFDSDRRYQNKVVELQLGLSDMSLGEGKLNLAKRVISSLIDNTLDRDTLTKIRLQDAKIHWNIDKKFAIRMIKYLLKTYQDKTTIRAEALKLFGSWMVEMKSEDAQTIINDYFLESINILQSTDRIQTDNSYEAFDALAQYADQEYQEINKYMKSDIFQQKVRNSETLKYNATKLKGNSEDIRRASVIYKRQSTIDETDIAKMQEKRNEYLKLSVRYYLQYLRFSSKNDLRQMFRIISLWLENKTNADVAIIIDENLFEIASYKILQILPQIVPHISQDNTDFAKLINLLVATCAKDHPHHALPIIFSVANSNKDDKYSGVVANAENNQSRILGAQSIINKFKTLDRYIRMVSEMEILSDSLIQLAYHTVKKTNTLIYKIPDSYLIKKVTNFEHMQLSTSNLPINKTKRYNNIIGIYKYDNKFDMVGGLNAPKKLRCVGTDGKTRIQLIKGKDDLRQDAVMQQVFTIMNQLLAFNKNTSNLLVRTYKVIPLSKRSGVIEWVQNSMPLGECLMGPNGVHRLYNKSDISQEMCTERFKKCSDASDNQKYKVYTDICKKFRPAFGKFFETQFLQPTVWYEKRRAYTNSVATSSMCGYILGIGDRHVQNILVDKTTAEIIHIDFGIAFEQGKVLPTPETIPFRLTRDIEHAMGIFGVEGTFRRACEQTMEVLRDNAITIVTILEVLLYDPLYAWTITPAEAYKKQLDIQDASRIKFNDDNTPRNVTAERALNRLKQKLEGTDGTCSSIEGQVSRLINQARDPMNLSRVFYGWKPFL